MEKRATADYVNKEKLVGYKRASELPRGAVRLGEKVMSWGQYIRAEKSMYQALCIDAEQLVWVVKTRYPEYRTRYGIVKDAEVNEVWDGKTGEFLCLEITGGSEVVWNTRIHRETIS